MSEYEDHDSTERLKAVAYELWRLSDTFLDNGDTHKGAKLQHLGSEILQSVNKTQAAKQKPKK